jgi:hypothetical protein
MARERVLPLNSEEGRGQEGWRIGVGMGEEREGLRGTALVIHHPPMVVD